MSEQSEPVGSLAEEAVKLLRVLNGLGGGQDGGSLRDAVGDLGDNLNAHIATGGENCAYCPVCQAIGMMRAISPEARAHLSAAGSSLLKAVATMMETPVPPREADPDSGAGESRT